MVSKWLIIGLLTHNVGSVFDLKDEDKLFYDFSNHWAREVAVAVAAGLGLYVPNLVFALWSSLGAKKSSWKIVIQDPSIILLPTFTFFTFAKMNTFCGNRDIRVKFSPLYTWINMAWSSLYGLAVLNTLYNSGLETLSLW